MGVLCFSGMGNSSSREEIIVDYDDEDDLLVPQSEPEDAVNSILLEDEEIVEDGHPRLHHSPIIQSLVSLTKESLIAFQPNENSPISLEKQPDKRENQETKNEPIGTVQVDEIVEEKKENPICLEKEPLSEPKAAVPINRVNLFEPFSVQFRVDTEAEASLKLYWGASSRRKPKDTFKSRFANGHYAMNLSKGLNQIITISSSHLPRFQPNDLKYLNGETESCIPLLIQLQARSENANRVHQQTIQANFVATNVLGTYGLSVQNVTVKIGQNGFTLYDIYGVGKDENFSQGDECVICMNEDSTTTLLPCRHMCLCSECAELFRSKSEKCPICRSRVSDLLAEA